MSHPTYQQLEKSYFELNSETFFSKANLKGLFVLSRFFLSLPIFDESISNVSRSGIISWWRMRILYIHQLCLSGRSPDLKKQIDTQLEFLEAQISCNFILSEEKKTEQTPQLIVQE